MYIPPQCTTLQCTALASTATQEADQLVMVKMGGQETAWNVRRSQAEAGVKVTAQSCSSSYDLIGKIGLEQVTLQNCKHSLS